MDADESGPDAAAIVLALFNAWKSGDKAALEPLIHPDVIFISTAFAPFEIHGRDGYLRFMNALQDMYSAPRSERFLGIDSYSPSMAALRMAITVGGVTSVSLLFHLVRDGQVVEFIDVIEDRARGVAQFVQPVSWGADSPG